VTAKKPSARKATRKKATKKAAAKPRTRKAKIALAEIARSSAGFAGPRHAVFVDVENTNSEQALFDVLDALSIDRSARPTEMTAVGNWRVVGQQLGRRLGALGAQLVHSAPARGVRDWSDLWIAVAAGCWLGQARPGDILEIISNDRAFDAVGDAAAARGVVFHRLQHRRDVDTPAEAAEKPKRPRRSRGGRRQRRRRAKAPGPETTTTSATPPQAPTPPTPPRAAEAHGASRDQMIAVIERLTNGEPGRWINLDVLERALKAQGFSRPPGSPRLVTRLRALKKDVEIDAHGRVRITPRSPS
jgi:hypothetical protein